MKKVILITIYPHWSDEYYYYANNNEELVEFIRNIDLEKNNVFIEKQLLTKGKIEMLNIEYINKKYYD